MSVIDISIGTRQIVPHTGKNVDYSKMVGDIVQVVGTTVKISITRDTVVQRTLQKVKVELYCKC